MNRTPNMFNKIFHGFVMLEPVSLFFSRRIHHWDKAISKLTKGRHTISELMGLPIIQLTTVGAKSGEQRTMPLVCLFDDGKIALIASNFGGKNNPGWYYNLKANPRCTVEVNGRAADYVARQAAGAEREKYWEMAVAYYKGYEKYKARAPHRVIPVMVLEPVE